MSDSDRVAVRHSIRRAIDDPILSRQAGTYFDHLAQVAGDARFSGARVDASDVAGMVALIGAHRITHVLNAVDPRFVMTIFDADPTAAAALVGTVTAADSVRDIKMTRLWTIDEAAVIRKKRKIGRAHV